MLVVIGIVVAFLVILVYVRTVARLREARKTRFFFEDRDTYLFLKVDRPLGSDNPALVAMLTLREALRLKIAAPRYERVLVDVSGLRFANRRAFWLLIGALGPALMDDEVKLAVVCKRRTPAAKHFADSGVFNPFPSERDAVRYLGSAEPRQAVLLDPDEVDALLVAGRRRKAA